MSKINDHGQLETPQQISGSPAWAGLLFHSWRGTFGRNTSHDVAIPNSAQKVLITLMSAMNYWEFASSGSSSGFVAEGPKIAPGNRIEAYTRKARTAQYTLISAPVSAIPSIQGPTVYTIMAHRLGQDEWIGKMDVAQPDRSFEMMCDWEGALRLRVSGSHTAWMAVTGICWT